MINYYLLKGQGEFLHVKQKQMPCLSKFYVCVLAHSRSSDTARQVTCMVRWHMPQVCILSNVCHLFPPMLEVLFSFPAQLALFFPRFPSPYLKYITNGTILRSTSPHGTFKVPNSPNVWRKTRCRLDTRALLPCENRAVRTDPCFTCHP